MKTQLVKEALLQFRNCCKIKKTDKTAIVVPSATVINRFSSMPSIPQKALANVAGFEAKQQIPFPLEETAFDWQLMPGSGQAFDMVNFPEILFLAARQNQRDLWLEPFTKGKIPVDLVQASSIALINYWTFNFLRRELKPTDSYDPETPPPFTAILSMGTMTTDLVVTNGYRVWSRVLPIGGWHFTKVLAKELKLTERAAEHLKRNQGANDKAELAEKMQPATNDLVSEVARSLSFFRNFMRKATIERIISLGNAFKTPGIGVGFHDATIEFTSAGRDFFERLVGEVTTNPLFQEDIGGFAPCYGLAVQALGWGNINTNLAKKRR